MTEIKRRRSRNLTMRQGTCLASLLDYDFLAAGYSELFLSVTLKCGGLKVTRGQQRQQQRRQYSRQRRLELRLHQFRRELKTSCRPVAAFSSKGTVLAVLEQLCYINHYLLT